MWHQVLTSYLSQYGGGSVDSMAGHMGWSYVQLHRDETRDLFESAKGAPDDPIKLVEGQNGIAPDAQRWKATESWALRGEPRAASTADMRAALPGVFKSTTGRVLAVVAAAATLAGALGVVVKPGTPEAKLLLALGVWLIVWTLISGALRDERDMAAAARAWPRLKTARPARYKFETARLRTPLPYALAAYATLGLALVAFWTLRAHGKDALVDLTGVPWWSVWIAVAALAVCVAVAYLVARARSNRLRAAYVEEYQHPPST